MSYPPLCLERNTYEYILNWMRRLNNGRWINARKQYDKDYYIPDSFKDVMIEMIGKKTSRKIVEKIFTATITQNDTGRTRTYAG